MQEVNLENFAQNMHNYYTHTVDMVEKHGSQKSDPDLLSPMCCQNNLDDHHYVCVSIKYPAPSYKLLSIPDGGGANNYHNMFCC